MAPRQGHKKSRTGCTRCKARKVKCDEKHPVCSGCERYPADCIYLDKPKIRNKSSSGKLEDVVSEPSNYVNGPASPYEDELGVDLDPESRRNLELLLLHNFSHLTAATLPAFNAPDKARKWMNEAIDAALEHPFLLQIMFSWTCLHLVLEPSLRTSATQLFDFEKMHRIYLNAAIREQRSALQNIKQSNAAALCWSALLMSYLAIRLLPSDPTLTSYAVPVQWISMANAVGTVYRTTWPLLPGGTVFSYISATNGPNFEDPNQTFDYTYSDVFRRVMDFDDGEEILNEDDRVSYDRALAYAYKTYQALSHPEPPYKVCRRCMAFGALMPHRFVELVDMHRPRALVIIAFQMSMTKAIEQYWWLRGLAERDVHGIGSLLPPKWRWAIEWPLQIIARYSDPTNNQNVLSG